MGGCLLYRSRDVDLMQGLTPAGEVLSCGDKKVPKETFPKLLPYGCLFQEGYSAGIDGF